MKFLILSVFFYFQLISVMANQVLIPWFSKWKYKDDGSNQGTAWRSASFDDSGWSSAFGQLGYGDNDESSIVNFGPDPNNKYVTTYFRKTVVIGNTSSFTNFTMNVRRDDGIVVFVNGAEVYRNNMPASPAIISYSTLASASASDDGNTALSASIASAAFVNGNNVIAVEVHQNAGNTTDLSFDLELIGVQASSPVLSRGPYLMVATPNSINVRWRTTAAFNSKVSYGTSPESLSSSVTDPLVTTEHTVQLTGLAPNTKYYYAIGSSAHTLMGDDETYFITPPPLNTIKPSRFWITGDFGSGTINSSLVRNAYLKYTGDLYTDGWLWLGDNAYNSGTETEYSNFVFNYRYERVFRKTCVWPALGNHDYGNLGYQGPVAMGTSSPYFTIFQTPQAGEAGGYPSGSPKYYSYNYSNIHFIALDSYGAYNIMGSPMYTWLQNDLASNTQRWTIVYFHHPPYSKGSHNSDTEIELIDMRQNIIPLLESYKVDLVLSGHSHSYERSFLIHDHYGLENTFGPVHQVDAGSGQFPAPYIKTPVTNYEGTVYAVVGCSGQVVGGTTPGYPHNAMYASTVSVYGSMVLDIHGDTLNAKLLNSDLSVPSVIDQFTIIKPSFQTVTLNVRAYIEGLYRGSGNMQGLLAPSVADTIRLSLVNPSPPFAVEHNRSTLLDISGDASATFSNIPIEGDSYYLVLKHRNSLETWSSDSILFDSPVVTYDFTGSASSAYGSNLKSLGDGNYSLYSGDINQDGSIDLTDQLLMGTAVINFDTGYVETDLTGDYIAESADAALLENNVSILPITLRP